MKTVKLFATVRDIVGSKTLDVPIQPGATVRDLVVAIAAVQPELGAKLVDGAGQLSEDIHIYVRGRNVVWLDELETVIGERDDVFIVPPMAGG